MAKDPNYSDVKLLLDFDGPNGSTNIIDRSQYGHAVIASGNAAITTAVTLFGKPTLALDGAADCLTLPDIAAFELGSGNLEISLHLKTTQTTPYACLIGRDNGTFASGAWALMINAGSTGTVQLWVADHSTGSPLLSDSSAAINDGTMRQVSVTRDGSTWRLFVDCVLVSTASFSGTIADVPLPITIGRLPGYSRDFLGNMAQIRISGIARYTASFTPPAAPYLGAGDLSGVVLDATGAPAARLVAAMREDKRVIVGSAISDGVTGAYSIPAAGEGAHTLNFYPAAGENLPALVLRGVVPV